jgi:hypothetical protein
VVEGVDYRRPSPEYFVVAGHDRCVCLRPNSLIFDTSYLEADDELDMTIARVSCDGAKRNSLGCQWVKLSAPEQNQNS